VAGQPQLRKPQTKQKKTLPKQRLGEGREELLIGKHPILREPPSDVVVEAGRVARGHHAPGRSLMRACHAPMRRGRWGTLRTSEDSEDVGEPNGEASIMQ